MAAWWEISEFWFLHKHTVGLLIFAQLPLFCKVTVWQGLWNNLFLIRSYLTANLQRTQAKLQMFSSMKLRMTNVSEKASRRTVESVRCVGKFQLCVVHYGWNRNSVLEFKAQVCVWPALHTENNKNIWNAGLFDLFYILKFFKKIMKWFWWREKGWEKMKCML